MATKLLLATGFGPFGTVLENPSGALANALGMAPVGDVRVESCVLPVTFEEAPKVLGHFVEQFERDLPLALLSMGVHPGVGFRLESCARARPTSDSLDTSGKVGGAGNPTGIVLESRRVGFDLEQLKRALPIPAGGLTISTDAGGYVCDWVFQHLLAHGERLGIPALFLHVPPLDKVKLEDQAAFVRQLVAALAAL